MFYRYRYDNEGKFRLQTVRYESLELEEGLDQTAAKYPVPDTKSSTNGKGRDSDHPDDTDADDVLLVDTGDNDLDDPQSEFHKGRHKKDVSSVLLPTARPKKEKLPKKKEKSPSKLKRKSARGKKGVASSGKKSSRSPSKKSGVKKRPTTTLSYSKKKGSNSELPEYASANDTFTRSSSPQQRLQGKRKLSPSSNNKQTPKKKMRRSRDMNESLSPSSSPASSPCRQSMPIFESPFKS